MIENVPLADAGAVGVIDGPNVGVRARVRARVDGVDRSGKAAAWFVATAATVRADAAAMWLVAAQPQPLKVWLVAQTPAETQVPAGSPLVRGLWAGHNWTLGALTFGLSVALFLIAAALRWLAGHPARFWGFVAVAAAIGTWLAAAI